MNVLDSDKGGWMNLKQLLLIYEAMTMNLRGQFDWAKIEKKWFEHSGNQFMKLKFGDLDYWEDILATTCYVGQPMKINDEMAVLRIALGSDTLRQLVDDINNGVEIGESSAVADDSKIIKKMAFLAYNFTDLEYIILKMRD